MTNAPGAGRARRAARRLCVVAAVVCAPATAAVAQRTATDSTSILGARIAVHRYLPAAVPRCPPVLLLSGDGGWELGVVDWARTLQAEGYEVVGLDAARMVRVAGSGGLAAIAAAWPVLRGLTSRPPVLLGYSRGATIGLVLAARAVDPPDVVLLGTDVADAFGGPAVPRGLAPGVRQRGAYVVDLRPLYRDRARSARVAIIHGRRDQVAPYDSVRSWFDSLPEPKLVSILSESGHGFASERALLPVLRASLTWAAQRRCAAAP
jgi:pimeloyl-ACP methyl ester carboxylesterase